MFPMAAPSVFNYYGPMYQPVGAATEAQLWSPAAQLGTMPNVLRFQSALKSLCSTELRAISQRSLGRLLCAKERGEDDSTNERTND